MTKTLASQEIRFKGLDTLINNVGGSSAPGGGALALTDAHWQETINANLFAAVRLDRAFLPSMLEQRSGSSSMSPPSSAASRSSRPRSPTPPPKLR